MTIKNLYAFDFDDTLAITSSLIGVRRTLENGEADPEFKNWVVDNSIDFEDIESEGTSEEIIWFSSEDFATYQQKHKNDLDYLNSNNLIDQYDFSQTGSIDLEKSSPISSMLDLLKNAQSSPDSLAIILTARTGRTPIASLSGQSIQPSNVEDIGEFLDSHGISLSQSLINTAGDVGVGPAAKASVIKSYIAQYNPENIYFYDDSQGNLDSVAALCQDYYPEIKISVFKVGHGGQISGPEGCHENYFSKFYQLLS